MGLQELHLVGQHAPALQIDVLGIGRHEGHGQQLHAGILGQTAALEIVAALAGRHHVGPDVRSALADRAHMIARQVAPEEAPAAVHADLRIAAEQRVVVERRRVIVETLVEPCRHALGGHDRIHVHLAAVAGERADTAANPEKGPAAVIGDLARVIEPHGIAVVDPAQGAARHVGAQHPLAQVQGVFKQQHHTLPFRWPYTSKLRNFNVRRAKPARPVG